MPNTLGIRQCFSKTSYYSNVSKEFIVCNYYKRYKYFVKKGLNMKKRLGLDIGISSIGFGVVEYDDKNFVGKIIDAGVRIFTPAENSKNGSSLAQPRREAKSTRKRLKRKLSRLYKIRKLLISNNFINQSQIEQLYIKNKVVKDLWDLRKEALSRVLTNEEFYRILIHIAKHRGFKSVRKSEVAKKEGELLKAIKTNYEEFQLKNYETIGEMFANEFKNGEPKRNKRENYRKSISRELLESEIDIIFEKQRKLGSSIASKDIQEEYKEIAFFQTPLQSMESMFGDCTFELNEKRASKCAYTSEIFTSANKLVNISIIDEIGNSRYLTGEEIKEIIEFAHKQTKVTYAQVKKLLNFEDEIKFNNLNYNKKDKNGSIKNPETETLIELKNYHNIRKEIEKNPKLGKVFFETIKYDKELFNNIATVLSYEKSDEQIVKKLKEFNINEEIINSVKDLSMNKTMHLSIKAMDKILPYMLDGMKYSEACEQAGYNHSVISSKNYSKTTFLPVLESHELTTNPVVNRAISQTRKVVNALIRKHGSFDNIIIETARDLSKSFNERKEIEKAQKEFQEEKENIRKECIQNGLNPDSPKSNLLRFRLWKEQGGFCVYSGKYIDPKKLADIDYTDIDHIIPYSRCFDDSLNNKVLCLSNENRNKGNKIPYEYFGEEKWHEFVERVKSMHLKSAKTNRLIRKTYSSDGFRSRNLNDTRYITIFIKDYIKENLDFGNNLKIETRNGALTAFLRTQWGLIKHREDNDKHHALDALVLACSTQGMVQHLSTISAKIENYEYLNGKKPRFKRPWETFNEDLEEVLSKIFVSRVVNATVSGELHDATIRSAKHINDGFTTLKTPLKEINLSTLEKMYDKERNINLYNIIKARLEQFNNDPKKAFEKPLYMKLSKEKGQIAPQIKSIKIKDNHIAGVRVRNGLAWNSSIIRVDVFSKENKKGKKEFFFVPIYISDMGKDLPNKAISTQKDGWIEMDNTYNFCFTIYSNTLLSINMTGKPEDENFWYFRSIDRSDGRLTLDSHDKTITEKRISPKSAFSIKKYQIDVLGEYHEIKHETRQQLKGAKYGI